jgi:hypothetical protein
MMPFVTVSLARFVHSFCILVLAISSIFAAAANAQSAETPATPVMVNTKFGGQIFGFDIDQNGTEGILSEAQTLSNGNVLAAVETFDQKTGKIIAVLAKTETQDDFVTLGVVGTSVGLVEHEHVIKLLDVQRTFGVVNPLSANKATGKWTPPLGKTHLLNQVSRNQGTTNNAVFAQDNSGTTFIPWVFSSNVAANTFGPIVKINDSFNFGSVPPPMAYNTVTNEAILGGGDGCFGCLPVMGIADLTKGTFSEFTGIGFGFINGIAVDSADNIACTTTEDDANVEFYDLTAQTGFTVILPNSGEQQIFSGADVEYDSTHKLFFVAQPVSSSSSGSSIYIYNTKGILEGTLNGFSFSNASTVIPVHIALNPSTRAGFVDGPSANQMQGFSY